MKSGIVILYFREGISYDNNKVYLVIGNACKGNEHLSILAQLSTKLADKEFVKEIVASHNINEFINYFK